MNNLIYFVEKWVSKFSRLNLKSKEAQNRNFTEFLLIVVVYNGDTGKVNDLVSADIM
jgi:hypothetical protein